MVDTKARQRLQRERPQGAIIAVLAIAGVTASLQQTLLIPIQGELPRLLDASRDATAWVITVTLLVSAICTPIAGRLGDMYGKRRVALVLLGLVVVGSVVAALSTDVSILLVGRALQGCGMGIIALGITILRDTIDPRRLGSAIALVSATLGVGGAVGLPLSALITEHLDWHMLFWISAALGVAVLVAVAVVVPESTLRTGGRFDIVGAIGLAIGLTGVLLGLSKGNEWGWLQPATLGALGGGLLVLIIWGGYQMRVRQPLIDLRVSAKAPVLITNIASIAMGFALFTSSIAFPQLLGMPTALGGLGLPLLEASLVLVPSGLTMLAMAPVAGRIERTAGPKVLLLAGAAVIFVVYLVAAVAPLSVPVVLILNMGLGVGVGLGYAAMPTLIMRAVPAHESAAANGLNTLMRGFGTSVAAAVVAAVLAQQSVSIDGVAVPDASSFTSAFLLGSAAALIAAIITCFIPKQRAAATGAALPPAE